VPSGSYRLRAFVYAGVLAGVGGAMYAVYIGYVAPDAFGPDLSALLLVVLMVGGMRSPHGAVVGAVAVTALTQGLAQLAANPSLPANLAPAMNVLAYGILIFLVMRVAPRGILPLAQHAAVRTMVWTRALVKRPGRDSVAAPRADEDASTRDPANISHV